VGVAGWWKWAWLDGAVAKGATGEAGFKQQLLDGGAWLRGAVGVAGWPVGVAGFTSTS
jgi:hypothetical protein